jgi:predicted Zn finger-like uncharacterized protein
MILACPICGTRYRIDDEALGGPAGREVRCANCGHTWHQAPAATEAGNGEVAPEPSRGDPAIETAPRQPMVPRLEIPPRPQSAVPLHRTRHGWTTSGRVAVIVLLLLVMLAVLVGIVARRHLAAMWPSAARFYTSIGLAAEPSGAGLVIGKIAPVRTAQGLMIDGEIANLGSTPRDVPRLRVALQDAAEKEVQFEVVDPPKARLQPGEIVHFATPFAHPVDAATGVVVTFASS